MMNNPSGPHGQRSKNVIEISPRNKYHRFPLQQTDARIQTVQQILQQSVHTVQVTHEQETLLRKIACKKVNYQTIYYAGHSVRKT